MSRPTKLSEKHWQVLEMLGNDMPRKKAAESIGWTVDHLKHLCIGDTQRAGGVATLFKQEYLKGVQKSAEETKKLIQANVKTAQGLIAEVFAEIKGKKKKTDADKKLLSLYTNALAKFTPAVNVKNLSYSYTKGLLPEELVHEFKRLKTVAEASFDHDRVPSPTEGRTGELSEVDE